MNAYRKLNGVFKSLLLIIAIFVLTSCGGGGNSDSKSSSNTSNLAATEYVASLTTATVSQLDTTGSLVAAASTIQPCKLMQLGATVRCLLPTSGYYSIGTGAGLASLIPNCTSVEVGATAAAVIPSANAVTCFQFVTNGVSTSSLLTEVALPDGITGIAELYVEFPNTAALKITDDLSGSNPMSVSFIPNQVMRIAVIVRTDNSVGGETVRIGVGVPAAVPPTNSTANQADQLVMNKTVSSYAPLAAVADRYYFYPLLSGQTTAELSATFPAGLTVGYMYAQKIADNNYNLQNEIYTDSSESGVVKSLTGLVPASGSGVSNGIMFHVHSSSSTQAAQAFSLRIGVGVAYVSYPLLSNTENLNTYEKTLGLTKSYSYLGMTVSVRDSSNNPVEGESVEFRVLANKLDKSTAITQTVQTDAAGNASYTANFPVCLGVDKNVPNLVYSVPGDHWLMNGQSGIVWASLPNSVSVESNPSNTEQSAEFYKICSERYLGRY
jgi:hypothetical protein